MKSRRYLSGADWILNGLAHAAQTPNLSSSYNDKLAHESFLEYLTQQLEKLKTKYNLDDFIVMGDLNMICDKHLDAHGGNPTVYPKSLALLETLKNQFDLSDSVRSLNPDVNLYTFSPGGLNVRNIFRRLDYILIPEAWNCEVNNTDISPVSYSDHRIVRLGMCKNTLRKNIGLWKHNDQINNDENYCREFKELLPRWVDESKTLADARSRWELLKFRIKGHSREFSIKRARKKTEFKVASEKRLKQLDQDLMQDPENSELKLEYVQARAIYDSILEEENDKLRFKARVNIYEQGEKSTQYFFRQIKQNASRSNISSLEINGKHSDSPTEIDKAIFKYYKKLYEEESDVSQAIANNKCEEFLVDDMPRISTEIKDNCDKKITVEEVRHILFKDLNSKKSPGNDGITVGLLQS